MKKTLIFLTTFFAFVLVLQAACAPHFVQEVVEPANDKTNVYAILAFILGIFSLIPYLNILALGGYLPALFHRLAKKKMEETGSEKGAKLLKSAKILSIIGFSIYALAALVGFIAATVVGQPFGILLLLLVAAIWGFFKLLGK